MGVYTLNGSLAITRSRDKLRAVQLFSRAGLPMPVTAFAKAPDDTAALIKLVGGAPLVIKFVEGTHGLGVLLAESDCSAEDTISAMQALGVAPSAHLSAEEVAREIEAAVSRHFAEDAPEVTLVDSLSANALATADKIRIRRDATSPIETRPSC